MAFLALNVGIVLYITSMWVAGVMQGLMWRAYNELGFLEYAFVETVEAMNPYYIIRALGGLLFLLGALVMAYNLWHGARRCSGMSVKLIGPHKRRPWRRNRGAGRKLLG